MTCRVLALWMLTASASAFRVNNKLGKLTINASKTILTSAGGPITSNKLEYNPLDGIEDPIKLIALLEKAAEVNGDKLAFRTPHQTASGGLVKKSFLGYGLNPTAHTYKYKKTTWTQYRDLVMTAAAAFIEMGLQPMDAVNIRGVNSEEWLIAFLGCIAAGGLPVGLYPTDSPEALKFKAEDSGAAFIVLGRSKDLPIYAEFIGELEAVKGVILWDSNHEFPDSPSSYDASVQMIGPDKFFLWKDFMSKGAAVGFAKVQLQIDDLMAGQAASVVYTSGTTGQPKGVMLSHDSLTWSAKTIVDECLSTDPPGGQFRIISFLPLNHIAGQMMDVISPLVISSTKGRYTTVTFPAGCYLRKSCSVEMLSDTRPVTFLGVPEVWDGLKVKLESGASHGIGQYVPWSVILKKAGLNKVMYAVSGAGPLRPDTIQFFNKIGIKILNIFGQSESSALGTAWRPEDFEDSHGYNVDEKFGSIGKAIGNTVSVDARGEIMLKGRNVMLGYLNRKEKTEETIKDGWLMTGDKGRIDDDKFVYLTGRLKEIMKVASEMIAPVAIEQGILKACNPSGDTILKQAIVVGDNMKFVSVLLTLLEEAAEDIPTGALMGGAKSVDPDLQEQTVAEAIRSSAWAARLSQCIGEYNNKGAAKNQEKVYRYVILPKDITAVASPDMMTPTFKIKRDGVNEAYKDAIGKCGGESELDDKIVKACPL